MSKSNVRIFVKSKTNEGIVWIPKRVPKGVNHRANPNCKNERRIAKRQSAYEAMMNDGKLWSDGGPKEGYHRPGSIG